MAKRVFLAEGDENIERVVTQTLKTLGCEVYSAQDGDEALKTINVNAVPSLFIIDAHLPEPASPTARNISGLQLCREILRDTRTRHIPLMVIKGFKTDEKAFRDLGIEEFLSRPLKADQLRETAHILLQYGSRKNIPSGKKLPVGLIVGVFLLLAICGLAIMIIGVNNIPFLKGK